MEPDGYAIAAAAKAFRAWRAGAEDVTAEQLSETIGQAKTAGIPASVAILQRFNVLPRT